MGQFLSHPLVSMISSNIPSIIQNVTGVLVNRSVEIKISNKTRSITLENTRTYLECGRCSDPPLPELSPGSDDTCRFLGSYPFWSVPGILVYEAESFTLAVYFSNHIDSNRFPIELGLELSPGKAHLGSLEDTYTRMAHGTYSSSRLDIKFNRCVVVGNCHGSVQLSHGPIKVTATMSSDMNSHLRVELDEQEGSREEARTDSPCRRERVQK